MTKRLLLGAIGAALIFSGFSSTNAETKMNATTNPSTTEESRRAIEDFGRLLYVERKAMEAMHRYFAVNLIQHNAEIGDGNHGDDVFLEKRREAEPEKYLSAEEYHTVVDNMLADGDLVAVKSHVYTNPSDAGRVFVDIWRVEGGRFVEHWDVVQPVPQTSLNSATMWCGGAANYADAGKVGDTVKNPTCGRSGPPENRAATLATVQAYIAMSQEPGKAAEAVEKYVSDDFVQHSPHIAQGKAALAKYFNDYAAGRAAEGRKSEIARIIVDGNLVLMHRRVTTNNDPRGVAYADLYKVRDGKVVEHWDIVQPIPTFSVAGHSMVNGPLEPGRTVGPAPAGGH